MISKTIKVFLYYFIYVFKKQVRKLQEVTGTSALDFEEMVVLKERF